MTMMVIASFISPLLIGIFYDTFKCYNQALFLMAIIGFIGGIFALMAKKPKVLKVD